MRNEMWRARIDSTGTSWCPKSDDTKQWLQFDFGRPKQVTEVQTRGRHNEDQWVTKYRLSYSVDGKAWKNTGRTYDANVDHSTLGRVVIQPPITARLMRLHP